MKTHLVKTFSITLLLSTPFAAHALPGDPYDQRNQVNTQITHLQQTIVNLQGQQAAIEPRKKEITLAASNAKGDNKSLLAQIGQQISDLDKLAVQTSLLIKEKEAALKAAQAKLPALAACIKTLEPSFEKLPALKKGAKEPSITIETLRKNVLPSVVAHEVYDFTNNATYFSKKDNAQKQKVEKNDKSAPKLPTRAEYVAILEERKKQPQTWTASIASGASYLASFVYTSKPAQTTPAEKK